MQVSLNMEKATNKVTPIKKQPEKWEVEFDRLEPHIISALKYQDRYNLSDIKEKIRQGLFHIWSGKRSLFMYLVLVNFPNIEF